MFYFKRLYSPDGGAPAGDGGAEAGVASGDPAPSLEDLGVPAEKAEKFRQRKKRTPQKAEATQDTATEETSSGQEEARQMSWDEFIKIPENNQRLQQMMSDRVNRVGREKAEYISKLTPALELIASRYGIKANDDGSYDADAITKAIQNDDSYYEQKAMDMGVDVETARRIDQLETENRRNEELLQKQQRDQQLREHFMKLQQQAQDVQNIMPGFNLQAAINDPKFLRLTSPEVGMSVKEAIWALHGDEIQRQAVEAVAQRARVDAANAIRSGYRPRENGGGSAAASAIPNLKTMTKAERRSYIMNKYKPPDR